MRADNITSYKQMLSGKLLLQISVKLILLIHWSLKVENVFMLGFYYHFEYMNCIVVILPSCFTDVLTIIHEVKLLSEV